jgi:hypothetical protein
MKLWVSEDRLVFVRQWPDGAMEVATREHPDGIWGPPKVLTPERTW